MSALRDQIRTAIERIERLDDEIAAANSDKSEVYKEAKAQGLNVYALKAAIAYRRKRDKLGAAVLDERESIVAQYLLAADGNGTPLAITRTRPDLPPHDPETGEITDKPAEVEHSAPEAEYVAEIHEFPELPEFLDRRIAATG